MVPSTGPIPTNSMTRQGSSGRMSNLGHYDYIAATSHKAKNLGYMLKGGRKANPDVKAPLALAKELKERFQTIQARPPSRQRMPEDYQPQEAPIDQMDLPQLLSAVGRDVRHLVYLTRGGIAMSENMVVPLLLIDAIITKLEAILARWPELQEGFKVSAMPKTTKERLTPRERMLNELLEEGEVSFSGRPKDRPDPIDRLIEEADLRIRRAVEL